MSGQSSKLAPAYLNGIVHLCGERVPIEELPALRQAPDSLRYLKTLGLARFSRISSPVPPLLEAAMLRSLEQAGLQAEDVDALILFSTTLDEYREHADLARLAAKLGLRRAIPYGMFYNQCTNYSQAIQLASFLAGVEGRRHILVVGYDVLDEQRWDRLMDNRVSVYSDVVVSFLVHAAPPAAGYRIDKVVHRYAPELSTLMAPTDTLRFITAYSEAFRGVCQEIYAAGAWRPADFKRLLTANYNLSVLRNLAELAGFSREALFVDHIADYAHCFAADQLIALEALLRGDLVRSGDRLMLVAVGGFVLFSSAALTRV